MIMRMKQRTLAIVAIAAVSMTCMVMPGICRADGGGCRIVAQISPGFPTAEQFKTYTAAAELIIHISENNILNFQAPPMQDILDTCIDGCCRYSVSDEETTTTVSSCIDGTGVIMSGSSGGSGGSGGGFFVLGFAWDVVCCEDGSDCDDDSDHDMVPDYDDLCPMTPGEEIVDPDGCSLVQLCPCDGPMESIDAWKNHGKYVSCIAQQSDDFVEMSLISEIEQDAIIDEAAESGCGKRR
jgi:hypothetical protein